MGQDGEQESAGGEETDSGHVELVGELQSPTQEEIGDDGNRWVSVGLEPLDNWVAELGQGVDDGDVASVADVPDVLYAWREVRVWRQREDQGLDGWVQGEKRVESWEVLGGDQHGDGYVSEGELVGQIEDWQEVALCWVWEHQDVWLAGAGAGHGLWSVGVFL